jgi:hypothetical protein
MEATLLDEETTAMLPVVHAEVEARAEVMYPGFVQV